MDVIAYSHTHWDREWYHSFEEFRLRFIEVFEDIIEKLQNNELSLFYLDAQTILIDDICDRCEKDNRFRTHYSELRRKYIFQFS